MVLNNPPSEDVWSALSDQCAFRRLLLWCGNPLDAKWLSRAQTACLSGIICVSQYHRDLYRVYRGFQRIEVAYSGVDLDLLEHALPNPAAEHSILFCSIPRRTKGFHHLLKAWPLVRQAVPDARLRVCGSARMHEPTAEVGRTGVLDRTLEEEFAELFSDPSASRDQWGIELLGPRSLPEVYGEMKAAAGVVVNCNWRGGLETYCRAAVEAQAAGVPVIGAARGALPEVVADGSTGLLVHKEDPRLLADAMVRLLHDPSLRARLGAAGQAWVRPLADYELLAGGWEAIAERALTGEEAPSPPRWQQDILRGLGYGYLRAWARNAIRGSSLERYLLGRMG